MKSIGLKGTGQNRTKNGGFAAVPTENGQAIHGGENMKHPSLPGYLCLSDMLDQDLSAYEYFQGLPPEVRQTLIREDNITTFDELQSRAAHLQSSGLIG